MHEPLAALSGRGHHPLGARRVADDGPAAAEHANVVHAYAVASGIGLHASQVHWERRALLGTENVLSLKPSRMAISRAAREVSGFCQAHSNCSACTCSVRVFWGG
jgi:hypothetical protein